MKKYILILITVILGISSCDFEKQLDIEQKGVLPVSLYKTSSDEETQAFIAAIYYRLRGNEWSNFLEGTSSYLSIKSYFASLGGDFASYPTFTETAESGNFSKLWSYYYSIIYWCNMIVENLPENEVVSATVKSRVLAEARTIRAIMMMNLVQLWGNPPLADHVMTGVEGNTPAEESWAFIENELNAAAEDLPSKNGLGGQSAIGGRLTKEAAYAYLGKAYLWQKKYNLAATTLSNKVIATGLYKLVDDFNSLNSYKSDFCEEYIWECDIENKGGIELSQAGSADITYTWDTDALNFPDGFYNGEGWGTSACTSESFGVFMGNHDVLSNGTKSKRYRGTVASYEDLLDGSVYRYSSGERGIKSKGHAACEGYFRVKLIPLWENIMGGEGWLDQYMHNNLPYMRYAEVLLNYAEAVAMGGSDGSISGLKALNMVRNRAGLPDAPVLDMNNDKYGIKAEKRAELFFENNRFIDIVRWGDAERVLFDMGGYNPTFYGYIDGNNSTPQSKANWKIIKNPILHEKFKSNKNELFPIPAVEMNNNPNLRQNPGW